MIWLVWEVDSASSEKRKHGIPVEVGSECQRVLTQLGIVQRVVRILTDAAHTDTGFVHQRWR